MSQVWLYHINPKSRYNYSYGWNFERPETILRSGDRTWNAGKYRNKIAEKDVICVFMKNIGAKPDGVYVVGTVNDVSRDDALFTWRPDRHRSAPTLISPIPTKTVRRFFPRSYGDSLQHLSPGKRRKWLALIGEGDETQGIPRIKARRRPRRLNLPQGNPEVSREHGRLGEKHVLKILRDRYPAAKGFNVVHVARRNPQSDHDIAVMKHRQVIQLVEVKTRVGKAGDPVSISERELSRRRLHRGRHGIFVVYLGAGSRLSEVVEIGQADNYVLKPQTHWLYPGTN